MSLGPSQTLQDLESLWSWPGPLRLQHCSDGREDNRRFTRREKPFQVLSRSCAPPCKDLGESQGQRSKKAAPRLPGTQEFFLE